MELHNLVATEKKRKRVGRGGGRGGTSGRGHKGQKARTSGTVRPGFEGGQMPLYRRLPKRGFTNHPFQDEIVAVNLGVISRAFKDGEEVTQEALVAKGIIKRNKSQKAYVVKVLASGAFDKKLVVKAHAFSQSAKAAIEKAGGEAKVV